MSFIYCQNSLSEKVLSAFLEENFIQFHPSFSEFCVNTNYSHKLYVNATTFEVWHENVLVGLICGYLNFEQKVMYIPYVCICKQYSGMGLASGLFDELFKYCVDNTLTRISLEVRENNISAISLYKKVGFQEICKKDDKLLMDKYLE